MFSPGNKELILKTKYMLQLIEKRPSVLAVAFTLRTEDILYIYTSEESTTPAEIAILINNSRVPQRKSIFKKCKQNSKNSTSVVRPVKILSLSC